MNDLQIRQGTVYRKLSDDSKFILINHNPMQLQSLLLRWNGEIWACAIIVSKSFFIIIAK